MTGTTREEQKRSKRRELYFAMKGGKLSLSQFKAQMKDLGYSDWEIDLYIDGDVHAGED